MNDYRIGPQQSEVIDRTRVGEFTWNGAPHRGYPGDTIASALAADGVRIFSRSYKYHRPRGILTATYHDPNTIVQVGADPNVRAGHRRLEPGMDVRAQNAWPSLRFDVRAANRLVGRFLPPGFYYKTFMSPRPLWPWYQRVLARFSPGGVVDPHTPPLDSDHRYAHPDVLVAGGGPAGMAAALASAENGASVVLADEEPELGGHLRYAGGSALLAELRAAVEAAPSIEVMTDAVVMGRFDHNWVPIVQRDLPHVEERLVMARAKTLVVAAGTLERPYVFRGNDLPGVMLSTAVRRLINLYAVKPGDRAVVLSANESGDAAAVDLERAGVDLVALLDARRGDTVIEAQGKGGVSEVTDSRGRRHAADLLVTATGWTTPTSLLNMAGDRPAYHPEAARFLSTDLPPDVLVTGGMVGDGSADQLVEHGRAVGREAARRAAAVRAAWQKAVPAASRPEQPDTSPEPIPPLEPAPHSALQPAPNPALQPAPHPALQPAPHSALEPALHPALYRSTTHGFVDYSEDVTSKDLFLAAEEGYDSMELAKRYTTVNMGPVQGKLEAVNALAVHGEATGRSLLETATTTWRPPYAPVRLGTLAGRKYEPVRYSPIHPWHEAHGATPLLAGQWVRPDHYGDAAAEVRAVRKGVGIIDVSPLGKIDLRGADVAKLLEFVYVNRWSRLAVGAVRYGVMCGEDGVIIDDGVTGRLEDDRYMMSTTSGGAGAVWNWLDEWLQTGFPDWDVKMTAVTDGYASINVAGPASRQLVGRLTSLDLDPERFGYMQVRTATVAGVADCFLWRIGFTGELSYEIHVPASHGLWVWEQLLEHGVDLGVTPFGVEAQRIMRLEKGHFIVGQDTDGLTQGFGMGIDWVVKLEKEDFAGKPELAWQRERDDYRRLVAIQPADPGLVPPEASQILGPKGDIRGRITSSRFSPTLERSICLGQVDPELTEPDHQIAIRLPDGRTVGARVLGDLAHFDPEGTRLRV